MMKILVFVLLIVGAYGCGQPTFPPIVSKVFSGKDARANSWPWQRHDIALITLSTPVKRSDSIMPACLPAFGEILPHNSPCYMTGWRRLLTGGPAAEILQQARLPVVGHETCSRSDWWGNTVTTSMVCAGGDSQLGICNGDCGGPLNCQNSDSSWDVHGVMSFGYGHGCNYYKKPSVFTRVSAYINWINNVMTTN